MAIRINVEELGQYISMPDPGVCLDLLTGEIVAVGDCPKDQVGLGTRGVRNGARYIAVPTLDEITQEFAEQRRQVEQLVDAHLGHDPEYDGLCEVNREMLAGAEAAANWLGTLKLGEPIHWIDEVLLDSSTNDGVLRIYEPATGEWTTVS